MIIGSEFSSKAKNILLKVNSFADNSELVRVSVNALCVELNMDKTECKNLLAYLEGKQFIRIETYGGPYLYSEISITSKGIKKAKS